MGGSGGGPARRGDTLGGGLPEPDVLTLDLRAGDGGVIALRKVIKWYTLRTSSLSCRHVYTSLNIYIARQMEYE